MSLKLSEERERAIIKAYRTRMNVRALVELLGISTRTLYVVLDRNDVLTHHEANLQRRRELGLSD